MLVNINTTIKEDLKTLNEYLVKCEEAEAKTKQLHFVTIKEFAEMRRMQFSCCSKDFQFT